MPTVERTLTPRSRLTSAVVMVMPADGPSLGMAPAGKWTWNRLPSSCDRSMPSWSALDRTYERAICADSFMTSPSWPVTVMPDSPGIDVASTNSTSPPTPVTARPVATPGTDVRSAASSWNRRRLR